jgi:hypothetical protein
MKLFVFGDLLELLKLLFDKELILSSFGDDVRTFQLIDFFFRPIMRHIWHIHHVQPGFPKRLLS